MISLDNQRCNMHSDAVAGFWLLRGQPAHSHAVNPRCCRSVYSMLSQTGETIISNLLEGVNKASRTVRSATCTRRNKKADTFGKIDTIVAPDAVLNSACC